jgi:hypothetical protein
MDAIVDPEFRKRFVDGMKKGRERLFGGGKEHWWVASFAKSDEARGSREGLNSLGLWK